MATDEAKLTLPEGVLGPIIQAQVVAALNEQGALVEELVATVLKMKVRDQQSYRDMPFLEMLCRNAIQNAVEAAVKTWIQEQAPVIEKEVDKALRSNKAAFAKSLVRAAVDATKQHWRLKVDLSFEDRQS